MASEKRGALDMEWVKQLNSAMEYLEGHLEEQVDYEQLGRIACCSPYHFQRMFGYLAGVSLSEYVRRRRMSLAAVCLQNGEKIIDVAGRFGYNSPTAFNRAFQSVHGIAPSAVKSSGVTVRSYPPISFKITIKGADEMEYRLEKKEAFPILGVCVPIERDLERNFEILPAKWQEVSQNGSLQRLLGLMEGQPMGVLGVSVTDSEGPWQYYIAVASSQEAPGFTRYVVPAATWAIFSGSGTFQSIQELERRIFTEWLPTSGYEYANAPDIEVYLNPDPANAQFEVWVPVVKK